MSGITLDAIGRENARSNPTSIATVCGADRLSYARMQARVDQLAAVLASEGVRRGDRIVWLAQNCHRWLETLVACARVGAVLCSLNWRQTVAELLPIVGELEPKVVLWQQGHGMGDLLLSLLAAMPAGPTLIAIDSREADGYETRLESERETFSGHIVDPDDPVLMLYTADPAGGSSGSMLSHTNLLTAAALMAQLQTIEGSTVNLASAPLFHTASLFALLPTFMMRGTNVFVRAPEPRLVAAAIHEHRCTRGFLLGPTAEEIVNLNQEGEFDLSSFATSLPHAAFRSMADDDRSPWGVRPGGYGQTETGMVVLSALGGADSTMTSGRVAPYAEVRVVDPADDDVEPGVVGEIIVRGATVHCGYFKRPHLNERRFRGGWWHTNDLGRRLADGSVVFVGPVGRLLKSGAENIYAVEVERCLESHPAVKEAAVVGVPDAVWVQSVKAIVVLEPDQVVTAEELIQHCRVHLASYKKPRTVEFLADALPRVGVAKDYAALDERFGGGNYPGSGT